MPCQSDLIYYINWVLIILNRPPLYVLKNSYIQFQADEAEVLEWLIQQQTTVGDEDVVESVDNDGKNYRSLQLESFFDIYFSKISILKTTGLTLKAPAFTT